MKSIIEYEQLSDFDRKKAPQHMVIGFEGGRRQVLKR